MPKKVRIGAGMGYYGDSVLPALDIARNGNVQYICFDDLAELTMAILEKDRKKDPTKGYTKDITQTMNLLLPECYPKGIKLITNAGGINPDGAVAEVKRIAGELGYADLKIGLVKGDNIFDRLPEVSPYFLNKSEEESWEHYQERLLFASVYLGAQPIVEALKQGADVVITGRTTDSAQFAAPLIYEFNWSYDDWDRIASAVLLGHLMECSGQVTGGNHTGAWWEIEDLDKIGYPIAEVDADGSFILTKTAGTGGKVCVDTVKEQFLYEIHDPRSYITPDVVVDFTSAVFEDVGPDQVRVSNVKGKPAPPTLKVLMGYENGWAGDGMMGYSWPHALEKAKKAEEILRKQMERLEIKTEEIHTSYIGYNSLHGPLAHKVDSDLLNEIYLYFAIRTKEKTDVLRFGKLLSPLAVNGPPFGGGGLGKGGKPRQLLGMYSCLIDRDVIEKDVTVEIVTV
ncbi:acyclic terpene utilization AtuA family protein [Neobacillus pocheonensis]|uniref:acyclic terpene utilization AtuA family protein n=1 Tax=Neobacillus pocheonensis TaxID=363869 RepID=UPI003D2E6F0C